MAKGNTCPSCGELKFHKDGAVRICSECGAVGWEMTPGSKGAGKGSKCILCGNQTAKRVYEDATRKFQVIYCSTCKSTHIL